MIERPLDRLDALYPADNLRRFSHHTGAPLRPLDADEPCPILFRDLGPMATALFLRGALGRLAGPLSPITYMRTSDYPEPYTDHGRIGRLILLRPLELAPWHSGLPTVYVSSASRAPDPRTLALVPAHVPLRAAAEAAALILDRRQLREALGGHDYDDALEDTLARVNHLEATLHLTERLAAPLRRALQAPDLALKDAARDLMAEADLSEGDLCAAWHHLPDQRRAHIAEALDHRAHQIQTLTAGLHPAAHAGGRG